MALQHVVRQPMTMDEFFRWLEKQDERYELVDGHPLMMAGRNQGDGKSGPVSRHP